jgi:hypothetical protein
MDLPGKESLRQFWPLFYRKIKFTGIIYMIDYLNKDTLTESIRTLHYLLNEPELSACHVLIVIIMDKKVSGKEEKNQLEDNEMENENFKDDQDDHLKMLVHFDQFPNTNLIKFHSINLYDYDSSSTQYNQLKEKMKLWLSSF